jgi:hypothetical protein
MGTAIITTTGTGTIIATIAERSDRRYIASKK